MDPFVDELSATTKYEIYPGVIKDNFFLDTPLLAYMRDHCLVPFPGGSAMQQTFLFKNMAFDILKDYAPISMSFNSPAFVGLPKTLGITTYQGFVDYAKKNPGKLDFASTGPGSASHLAGELLNDMAHIDTVHVPYKGIAQMMTDIMGNQIPLGSPALASAMGPAKAGKVKILAVTSARRSPQMPDVPTVAESGVPGFDVSAWNGVLVPAQTPDEIVRKLHGDMTKVVQGKDFQEALQKQGLDIDVLGPAEFKAFIAAELSKWAKLVKDSGAKLD